MTNNGFTESDWSLFRKRLPEWQEAYMNKLCKEYINILIANDKPSKRFWEIEERVKFDKKKVGVQVEISRSKMVNIIISLILEGTISLEDLDGFSEQLIQAVRMSVR